ncbi:MAG: DCC1-like thiol-disulfide oxidoreductase family protein [Gemmatimonadota bacterium]|nr:DCC1-like thiol-disulfide oxidoreductase family protein [Gemmatimonadota bacterium]
MLFFDGVCGLCNRFVDFMLRADSQDLLRYAPLQGETARRMLGMDGEAGDREAGDPRTGDPEPGNPQTGDLPSGGPHSFVFLEKDRQYEQSNAVLHALIRLGGAWRLIAVLYVFPRPLRDLVYRIVARNRYRWFGRRDACRMPTPEERGRFLP